MYPNNKMWKISEFPDFSGISRFLRRSDIPALPDVKNQGCRKNLREPSGYFENIGIFQSYGENRMEKFALVLILQPVQLVP